MKKIIKSSLSLVLSILFCSTYAQAPKVNATNDEISKHLDLEAVATLFGTVENIEDFEMQLNDPELQISNLDLNEDGYVDYLRVIESQKENTHLVIIQAVVGDNLFQDVASIDVSKDDTGQVYVQIIGNPYFYGLDFIIEPAYAKLWGSHYRPWHSPYYWKHYPPKFQRRKAVLIAKYQKHISIYIKKHHIDYKYVVQRRSPKAVKLEKKISKNYYAKKHLKLPSPRRHHR